MGRNCDVPPHIPTDFTTPMRLVYVLMIAAALEKLVHVHLFLPRIFLPFLIARYERHTRHGRCDPRETRPPTTLAIQRSLRTAWFTSSSAGIWLAGIF
jgi:hypothetical protein